MADASEREDSIPPPGTPPPPAPTLDYETPSPDPRRSARTIVRAILGYLGFSFTMGFAGAWGPPNDNTLQGVSAWLVPITALAFCIWQARQKNPGYLIGFAIALGSCGLLLGICALQM